MTEEQIKEYLNKYGLNTKDLLANHIMHLKRNTKPNTGLISELVYVLEDEGNLFFNIFSAKKDKILGGYKKPTVKTNSTRYEFPKEETHTSYNAIFDLNKVQGCPKGGLQCFCDGSCHEKRSLDYSAPTNSITSEWVRNNTGGIVGDLEGINRPPTTHNGLQKQHIDRLKEYKEYLITKSNRVEKEMADELQGIKESQEAYKETEGKLFYELDWGFITQMAERMSSNKKEGKYSLWNWKKPMTLKGLEDLKQATMRHLLDVMDGKYEDDGREFGHIEAISDNMMMINYQLKLNKG